MRKILYMHTGSGNHGCEAIIRSTASLLGGPKDIVLWSLTKTEDYKYGVNKLVEEIVESEQLRKYSLSHLEALFRRKVLGQSEANLNVFIKTLFKDSMAISVGGDNYCYEWSAKQAIQLDREIRKYCSKNVLWGCSINPEAITLEMEEDLRGFDLITAREPITYRLLKAINPNTVQVADPAFLLGKEEGDLPQFFVEGNTVGINISPMVMEYVTDGDIVLLNYYCLIQYILENTDMNVCLIPHVIWEYTNDRKPIKELFNKFKYTKRICMVDDCSCEKLKGYISKCRFFVGARTHATIAAYSTGVPTLVVGYSVKSKGIAEDLFGTCQNYVIPVQDLTDRDELTNQFIWLMQHEEEQKRRLNRVLPDYIERAKLAKRALADLMMQQEL